MNDKLHLGYLMYDPLKVFLKSKTPAGLYARQKWIHEDSTVSWQSDFDKTVKTLLSGQKSNGSWENSPLITIHRLFGLHLTVRKKNKEIDRALAWLLSLDLVREVGEHSRKKTNLIYSHELRDLPFSQGCYNHVMTCAILFLASIFGLEHNERVISIYERFLKMPIGRRGKWCNWSCSNNFMRACIVHPDYAESYAVKSYFSALLKVQKDDGSWPAPIPFYQTVNALGHLDNKQANTMLQKAYKRLYRSQNRDGTWGRTDKEWKTFLIVHALKRKPLLSNIGDLT